MPIRVIRDIDWIRQAFMLPENALTEQDQVRRVLSEVNYQLSDTTLGGNLAINAPPQFTRNADIKRFGRNSSSKGMGRYYYEAIEANGQNIHMRFGVPQFNSLNNFFFNFYNPQASSLARTGRTTSIFYKGGRVLGNVAQLPFMPLIWLGSAFNFLSQKPTSKYYYLKPTMTLYWDAVNTMCNTIATNMGIVPRVESKEAQQIRGLNANFTPDQAKEYAQLLPDILKSGGGIDVFAVATRAARNEIRDRQAVREHVAQATSKANLRERLLAYQNEAFDPRLEDQPSLDAYIERYLQSPISLRDAAENSEVPAESTGTNFNFASGFVEQSKAEWEDGAAWVTLKVDHTGSSQESFSNTVGESEIAAKINAMSGASRSTRFSLAEGNTGVGLVDFVTKSFGDIISGTMASFQLSGLAALAGSAFADIPQTWQSSTAQLTQHNYTVELRSPYGDPMSRFMNLIVPLTMLLAGTLPLSTGKQSYTSPFLCEIYSKGRGQTRLGMITSLSVTRGVGNVGWTRNHEPLGIDISFTVTDLSTILHMPLKPAIGTMEGISTSIVSSLAGAVGDYGVGRIAGFTGKEAAKAAETAVLGLSEGTFDDDTAFSDYMAVLGSLSLEDQVYSDNRWRLRTAARQAAFESWKSPYYQASQIMDNSLVRWIKKTGFTVE